MTAVRSWDVVDRSGSDAELARACVAGDKRAFAAIYDRYADRLHNFCVGMLADRDGAADCVQDVFCIAATRLPQLRDPDKLRPWLYSIARNQALRRIRDRRRETPSDDLPDTVSGDAGPDTLASRTELADLIADAAGGLSDRDSSVLELAFRHGLNGPDLADALGISLTHAGTIVQRLRHTIERSLGALLVARRVRNTGGCPALATVLDGWDGHFNVLMRKRISRHIEACNTCDEQRRRLVSPAALLGAAPVFIPAPAWLRNQTLSEVQLTCGSSRMPGNTNEGGHSDGANAPRGQRSWCLPAAALVAAVVAVLGLTFVWLNMQKTTIQNSIEVSEIALPPAPPEPPNPPKPPPHPLPAPPSSTPVTPATPAPPVGQIPSADPPFAEPTPTAPPPISVSTPVIPVLPPLPTLPPSSRSQPPSLLPGGPIASPPTPPGVVVRGPGNPVASPIDPPRILVSP